MSGKIIQFPKTNLPPEHQMSAAVGLDEFRRLVEQCERREQTRSGITRSQARERLARKAGVSPGTLYNLARDRLKRLDFVVRDRLTAYAVRDLQASIERLTHELEMARQMGAHPTSPRVGEIEKHLTAARALLIEAGIGGEE